MLYQQCSHTWESNLRRARKPAAQQQLQPQTRNLVDWVYFLLEFDSLNG